LNKYYLKWPMTAKCLMNCKFCYNKKSRKNWSQEINKEDLKKFISIINNNEYINGITLSGGEPTISNNFFDFCDNINKPFGFISTGDNLFDKKFINVLENKNLQFITISIDCLNPIIVKEIRGKDVLNNQLKTIKYLIYLRKNNPKCNFQIYINTVLTKMNVNEIEKLVDELANNEIDRLQIFRYFMSGRKDIDSELKLSFEREIEITDILINLYNKNRVKWDDKGFNLILRHLPPIGGLYYEKKHNKTLPFKSRECGIKRNTIYLNSDTTLNLCKIYHKDIFNEIKHLKFAEIDFEILKVKLLDIVANEVNSFKYYNNYFPCSECELLNTRCNPCTSIGRDGKTNVEYEECISYFKLLKSGRCKSEKI